MNIEKDIIIECTVQDVAPYNLFTAIKKGEKIYENRLFQDKWLVFGPSVPFSERFLLKISNGKGESITRRIIDVTLYSSFRRCLAERLTDSVPRAKSVKEALREVYDKFYTSEQQAGKWVVSLELYGP